MVILPSLQQLRFLCALAEQCHFGRAAENCAVTQSTLSGGIKELEARLGITLFERGHRHVMLTPLGKNSIGGSGVLSLRHFGLVLFIPWGVGAEESGAAKYGFGAATLSGTGSASPRPDRNSWLRGCCGVARQREGSRQNSIGGPALTHLVTSTRARARR